MSGTSVGDDGRRKACGVSSPHGEVLLFRQKDPKPWAPGRGPPGAFATVPISWAAELASLKQSSPPTGFRDCGAASPAGARKWRDEIAGVTAGKRQIPRYARNGNKCQKELVFIEGKDRHTIANRHSDEAVPARGVADTCV